MGYLVEPAAWIQLEVTEASFKVRHAWAAIGKQTRLTGCGSWSHWAESIAQRYSILPSICVTLGSTLREIPLEDQGELSVPPSSLVRHLGRGQRSTSGQEELGSEM